MLRRAYRLANSDILAVLQTMSNHAAFELQARDVFEQGIRDYSAGRDFADSLVVFKAVRKKAKLPTFDKKLAKRFAAELV